VFWILRNLRCLREGMEAGLHECFYMRAAYTHATALPVPTLPAGLDSHYKMEHRLVWNDERRTNEEHIFVLGAAGFQNSACGDGFCAHVE